MSKRTRLVLWISGVILLFAGIFLIWAYDTGKLGIKADTGPVVEDASQLKTLPSPDQSTFNKIFTAIANIFQ